MDINSLKKDNKEFIKNNKIILKTHCWNLKMKDIRNW